LKKRNSVKRFGAPIDLHGEAADGVSSLALSAVHLPCDGSQNLYGKNVSLPQFGGISTEQQDTDHEFHFAFYFVKQLEAMLDGISQTLYVLRHLLTCHTPLCMHSTFRRCKTLGLFE
jgi:hypothetical protein